MADIQAIVDQIKGLTLLEASELVKAMEETFGVSAAAAAVAAAPAGAAAGEAAAPAEEQTEFDVIMTSFGENKLNVVKVVKNITGASLMDAKKLVEAVPAKIKEAASKDDAAKVKKELEEAGATVELK